MTITSMLRKRSVAVWIFISLFCAEIIAHDPNCEKGGKVDPYHPHVPKPECVQSVTKSAVLNDKKQTRKSSHNDDIDFYHEEEQLRLYSTRVSDEEKTAEYWNEKAQNSIKNALENEKLNKNVAKNTILFLGDGMGVQTVTAGRVLKGQLNGKLGAEYQLAMDKLPHVALSKTYNVDYQVPDSAGTATAFACGVKTRMSLVGVNAATVYGDCASSKGNEVRSVLKDAKLEGKSTGIISTTYLVHATPAATYANTARRSWYDDTDLSEEAKKNHCKDIAQQLYDNMPLIDVALGGGRRYFRPNTVVDEDYPDRTYTREDGQDLIKQWQLNTEANNEAAAFVRNKEQFNAINSERVDHLWGMFAPGSMDFEADRDPAMQPSIAEMTRKAIEILQKNEKGFYLMVEGGRIDHAHHDGNAYRSLHDTVAFDDAIEVARSMTSDEDTLLIVTADHSHTFNMGQYAVRGNPILGLAPSNEDPSVALDLKKYTSLSYGNGPGYQGITTTEYANITREDVTQQKAESIDYLQQTAVPMSSETHGGEDVIIMASGPLAHLFHGVHEQHYIAHVMRYAACLGENKNHCIDKDVVENPPVEEEETIEFLGYNLAKAETEAALYSLFAIELVFTFFIFFLCGVLIRQKKF